MLTQQFIGEFLPFRLPTTRQNVNNKKKNRKPVVIIELFRKRVITAIILKSRRISDETNKFTNNFPLRTPFTVRKIFLFFFFSLAHSIFCKNIFFAPIVGNYVKFLTRFPYLLSASQSSQWSIDIRRLAQSFKHTACISFYSGIERVSEIFVK